MYKDYHKIILWDNSKFIIKEAVAGQRLYSLTKFPFIDLFVVDYIGDDRFQYNQLRIIKKKKVEKFNWVNCHVKYLKRTPTQLKPIVKNNI